MTIEQLKKRLKVQLQFMAYSAEISNQSARRERIADHAKNARVLYQEIAVNNA